MDHNCCSRKNSKILSSLCVFRITPSNFLKLLGGYTPLLDRPDPKSPQITAILVPGQGAVLNWGPIEHTQNLPNACLALPNTRTPSATLISRIPIDISSIGEPLGYSHLINTLKW